MAHNITLASLLLLALCLGAFAQTTSTTSIPTPTSALPPPGGPLIFSDDFDKLDLSKWQYEVTASGGGNGEFEYYTSHSNNSYVRDGVLFLRPTLTSDRFGEAAVESGYTLNLWAEGCTTNDNGGCTRTSGNGRVLPPIQSARLNTQGKFDCKYCHVQFSARLPRGDWIWPALWMLPTGATYGGWPRSGEIDIMESRGNNACYPTGGVDKFGSTLHWGPHFPIDPYNRTHTQYRMPAGDLAEDFHVYGLIWNTTGLLTYIDSLDNIVLNVSFDQTFYSRGNFSAKGLENPWPNGSNATPFDKPFFLLMNVAVGGIGNEVGQYFPDEAGQKPWKNSGSQESAMASFWQQRHQWLPSWKGEDVAMAVDWVRVYQL